MRGWIILAAALFSPAAVAQDRIIPVDLSIPPFQFESSPVIAANESVDDGAPIVRGRLRYGYTARLAAPFTVKNKWGTYDAEAGDAFYGVPFVSPFRTGLRGIVYCNPRTLGDRNWATCILAFEKKPVTMMVEQHNPYLVSGITAMFDVSSSTSLKLTPGPNELADELEVRVAVKRWSGSRLEIVTDVVKGGTVVSSVRESARVRNGAAEIAFGAGLLRLRPGQGGGGTVEVVRPIPAAAPIVWRTPD